MVTSTQITNTEIFALLAVLVFKLLSHNVIVCKQKIQWKRLKSRQPLKKIKKYTGKLLQNYK